MKNKKIISITVCMTMLGLITACDKQHTKTEIQKTVISDSQSESYINNQAEIEDNEDKKAEDDKKVEDNNSKFIEDAEVIFNNIYYEENPSTGEIFYQKIRKDFLECQSNQNFFNDKSNVLDVIYDTNNDRVVIKCSEGDDEDKFEFDIEIKIINKDTIILNDRELKRVADISKAVEDLAYTFGVSAESTYGLDKFLGVSEKDIFEKYLEKDYLENNTFTESNIIDYSNDLNDDDIHYINSKISKEDALDKVAQKYMLPNYSHLPVRIVMDEMSEIKFGDLRGYTTTIKESHETHTASFDWIFVDVETGNIYKLNFAEYTIDTNEVLENIYD